MPPPDDGSPSPNLAKDAWRRGEASGDPAEARRWLERARRLAPGDDMVLLSLATACLRGGDAAEAMPLFASLAERFDLAEAWLGLSASALRLGDRTAAAAAMQALLSRHAATAATRLLAAAVARTAGLPGWCAVDEAGRLHADAPADLVVDGQRITPRWTGSYPLPPGSIVSASRLGRPLLGSPIERAKIDEVEGLVEATRAGLRGWAWHPRNPQRDPILLVDGRRVVARKPLETEGFTRPLARPRAFRIAARQGTAPIAVTALDGRPLLGSPVHPQLAPVLARPAPLILPARKPVDVVIPVHGGLAVTLACLDSVLPTLRPGGRVHVVDDAGRDPALAQALDRLAAEGHIVLHRLPENRGYPGAANVGLRAAAGRDVALLNNDTVVPAGWLAALSDAAYSAADIGTACPLSNEAGILSYPDRFGGNAMPDPAPMAALAQRANGTVVDIPVAVGFCMFIRHDCLEAVGLFREDAFAQGYGEETEWSLRARHGGWRHVAVPGCFVAHRGGASFGAARQHLLARNTALLNQLHPGYDALVARWIARDPLGPARRRMDALRWRRGRAQAAVILITHAGTGGVARVVMDRAAALRAGGLRPVLLRPDGDGVAVGDPDTPNLRYRLPDEGNALLRLLRAERVARVELHHTLGHAPAVLALAARLGVPQEVFVHDYAQFCARINLVRAHRYCGEPPVGDCVACVAEHGSHLTEPIGPASLVHRSATVLAGASRVVVPSADTAARLRRHFPAVAPVIQPWGSDDAIPPPPQSPPVIRHLCIIGAIGIEKGYDVLLACVRDVARRALPLRFTVVGFTADDATLLDAGPVFVTGRFAAGEAETLVRQQDADLAFIPSIWPETWCFALGEAWRAGLRALVFDLGAQAERVRRTGWGHVLPLGLPPRAINDWILRSAIEHCRAVPDA